MHAALAQGSFVSPRAIDVSTEALDASVAAVETDRHIAEAFLCEPWPQVAELLQRGGMDTLLGFIQHTPGERYAALPSPDSVCLALSLRRPFHRPPENHSTAHSTGCRWPCWVQPAGTAPS